MQVGVTPIPSLPFVRLRDFFSFTNRRDFFLLYSNRARIELSACLTNSAATPLPHDKSHTSHFRHRFSKYEDAHGAMPQAVSRTPMIHHPTLLLRCLAVTTFAYFAA